MSENNVYGRFASFFKNYELKEADKYIKRVFPNAEFYIDYEHALVFERIGEDEEMLGKEVTKHDCPLELLREQQKYMGLYLSVLEKRALIENVEL